MHFSCQKLAALLLSAGAYMVKAESMSDGDQPTTLKPTNPSGMNRSDSSMLVPNPILPLYFAAPRSSDDSTAGSGIFAQLKFNFTMPSVALDSSAYIAGVVCPSGQNTMMIYFNDSKAFSYATNYWRTPINLITSVSGCGSNDTNNGYFTASSIKPSAKGWRLDVTGQFREATDITNNISVNWGASSAPDDGSDDGTQVHERATADFGQSFEVSPQIISGVMKGKSYTNALKDARSEDDPKAPWPKSWKIWGAQANAKRSMRRRDGADAAFNMYCVDCNINGRINIGGRFDVSLLPWNPKVTSMESYLKGSMHAGLFLGLDAHAQYKKQWHNSFLNVNLAGWAIPNVISVGPYLGLDLDVDVGVSANGTLLIGGALDWPNFGVNIDVVNPTNSRSYGFTPQLSKKLEAKAGVSASASIGLPLSVGLQVLLGPVARPFWSANVAVKDTPSINADASMSVQYTNSKRDTISIDDNIATKEALAARGTTCNGVSYDVFARNEVKFVADAKIIGHKEASLRDDRFTIAQGCAAF